MKLFLVERTDKVGYDEFESFVVAARTYQSARQHAVKGSSGSEIHHQGSEAFRDTSRSTVKYIGEAAPRLKAGVVHSAFRNG